MRLPNARFIRHCIIALLSVASFLSGRSASADEARNQGILDPGIRAVRDVVSAMSWRRNRAITEVAISNRDPYAMVVVEDRRSSDYGEVLLRSDPSGWRVVDKIDGLFSCARLKRDAVSESTALNFITGSRIKTLHHSMIKQIMRC